jgi:hypothetical protein
MKKKRRKWERKKKKDKRKKTNKRREKERIKGSKQKRIKFLSLLLKPHASKQRGLEYHPDHS